MQRIFEIGFSSEYFVSERISFRESNPNFSHCLDQIVLGTFIGVVIGKLDLERQPITKKMLNVL